MCVCVSVCLCVCVCDTMRSNSFSFVLAPFRRSLSVFGAKIHTKGLRVRSPARPEVEERRKVREQTERAAYNRGQKRTVGLR